ncbi:PadR family transcriptional regulator [Bacillus cereus]|nr:PadR family transcriptional regulator [Bacillus cereus]OOQ95279.1 PadR family transcriptional regulator [Bacillus cereus]
MYLMQSQLLNVQAVPLSKSEDLVRIALFEKLDYEARKEILTTRQNVLQEQLTAIQSLDVVSPFITEVVEFTKSRIEHELHWIISLMKKI